MRHHNCKIDLRIAPVAHQRDPAGPDACSGGGYQHLDFRTVEVAGPQVTGLRQVDLVASLVSAQRQ
jgi:hypothetical protein